MAPRLTIVGKRFRYWTIGLVATGAVLVGAALVVAGAGRAAPGGPAATITGCDPGTTGTTGTVGVAYTVANHDRSPHDYRVLVTVAAGSTVLGWSVSQVNRVAGGSTATARVPVTVNGATAGATCTVHAEVYDGHSGHAPDPVPHS